MSSFPSHRRHHSASSGHVLRSYLAEPANVSFQNIPRSRISPSSGRRRPGSESDVLDAKAAAASLHHQDSLMLAYHQRPTVVAGHSVVTGHAPRQAKPVYVWSQIEVCKWLKKHLPESHAHYVDLFARHDVTGKTLLMLNDTKLLRMGVRETSHRSGILNEILKLQMKNYMQTFKGLQSYGMFDIQ